MIPRVRHALIAGLAICATTEMASAGGLDADLLSPRAIARAGATTVSDDGAGALLANPAGIVRRHATRLQLSISLHDRDANYRTLDAAASGNPTVTDRGGSSALPLIGLQHGIGRVVLGLSYADTGAINRALPEQSSGQPPADVARLFPHRYAGVSLGYRRRVLAAGAAVRISDWLGVGVAVSAARVELSETRAIWAGFDGRDNIDDPTRDLRLSLDARDSFIPGASVGILVAPPQVPMELAVAADVSAGAALTGDVSVTRVNNADFPAPELGAATSAIELGRTLRVHAGLRYLGDRLTVELGGQLSIMRDNHSSPWSIKGVVVRDETGQSGALTEAVALVSVRNHAAVRGAVDVEVVRGFLWLTAGYALRTSATARSRLTPVFGDLGAHTFGMGAETNWKDLTLSLGYARSISRAMRVEQTAIDSVNPFAAGTKPAALGLYDRAEDSFGATVEVAW